MTHLQPSYLPNYGKHDRDFIHLEGELEFPADMNAADLIISLQSRAEQVGGVVSREDRAIRVYPWNGPGSFRLHYPSKAESVDQIDVLDRDGEVVEKHPIPELREQGERADRVARALAKHMEEAESGDEPSKEGETFRIDFSKGELEPVENGDGDDE